jgi:hypothetical protein
VRGEERSEEERGLRMRRQGEERKENEWMDGDVGIWCR